MPTVFGMMRIKNEARWIADVLASIQPVCDRIVVLDDHSTDDTVSICRRFEKVDVIESPFEGLNESRDKNFLLERLMELVPAEDQHFTRGNPESPYFALCCDGDEVLEADGPAIIRETLSVAKAHSFALQIRFLWNNPETVRVDGVYGTFARPSLFRLMNSEFRFMSTPWGEDINGHRANFHCASIPQEMLHHSLPCRARLWHWGYIDAEKRAAKFAWYNAVDGGNYAEDQYRHVAQGDDTPYEWLVERRDDIRRSLGMGPARHVMPRAPLAQERLKWAGPLQLAARA